MAIPGGSSPLAVVQVIFPGFRSWGFTLRLRIYKGCRDWVNG